MLGLFSAYPSNTLIPLCAYKWLLLTVGFQPLCSAHLTLAMSSTAVNFHHPNLELFPCRSKPLKPLSPPRFPTSKLAFSGGLVPKKAASVRNKAMVPTSKVEMNNLLPSRNNGNGDEAVRVLQREEYVDGSSDLGPGLAGNGLESTLNRLSKWLMTGLFAVVILCRHDAEAMWAVMGSVVNSMLSIILKRILNQERPLPSLRSEPGMPSSHSQSIFYIDMFAI